MAAPRTAQTPGPGPGRGCSVPGGGALPALLLDNPGAAAAAALWLEGPSAVDRVAAG